LTKANFSFAKGERRRAVWPMPSLRKLEFLEASRPNYSTRNASMKKFK